MWHIAVMWLHSVMVHVYTLKQLLSVIGLTGLIKVGWNFIMYSIKKSTIEISKRWCSVSYTHNGRRYKIMFPRSRRNIPILSVTDQDGKNVTVEINQYIGVGNNFHGIPTTPRLLGYDELRFTMLDEKIIVYMSNDKIIF